MRGFLRVVAAAAFLAAGTSAAWAQGEFPLKYVLAEENDPLNWDMGYSGSIPSRPPPIKALPQKAGTLDLRPPPIRPPQIKALPEGLSDKVRCFAIWVGGKPLWAVLDPASPPKLYVDMARMGDLSSVAPLVGKASGSQCSYGPIDISTGTGESAPTVKVLFVSRDNNQILGVRAAGYMAGDVKLDGQTYRVAVLDKNLNGRYECAFGKDGMSQSWWRADAIAIDVGQDGKFSRGGDGSEIMPLVKAVRVKDGYYHVQVAPDGSSIKFEKYEPKMGTLDVGIAASLTALSDTGTHNLRGSGGKWQVPEGRYTCQNLSITKIDADGKEWRLEGLDAGPLENFEIRGGETTAIKIGLPLTLKVDAERPESGQISLNLALVGKGGETYSVSVGLQTGVSRPLPPKVKVFDASGKLLAEGNSEYG